MKEQLTIQEFSAYLPWEVNVSNHNYSGIVKVTLFNAYDALIAINDNSFRLLLLPLSHLTKEIEHKGEKFVPIAYIADKYYTQDWVAKLERCIEDERWVYHLDYSLILHLHEWHFDTFGLIDRGLAIDKTTIL